MYYKYHNRNFGREKTWELKADLNAEEQDNEAFVHSCATRKKSGYNFWPLRFRTELVMDADLGAAFSFSSTFFGLRFFGLALKPK